MKTTMKKTMEENKYDQESIRELLTWAQNTLNNKTYPEGEIALDKCIKVKDVKAHLYLGDRNVGCFFDISSCWVYKEARLYILRVV